MKAYMITNGLLLGKNAKRIAESGISRVGISIDGAEKTHFIRNFPGSFKAALKGARKLKKVGVSAGAVTHISKANIDELEEMYNLFKKEGFDFWQIQIAFPLGRMKEQAEFPLEPEQIEAVSRFVYEKQLHGKPDVVAGDNLGYYSEPPIRKRTWKGCFAGRHIMGMEADGAVKGCLSLPGEFVEGNVKKESLRDIWEDPQRFKYNRYFSRDMLEGYCKDCPKGEPCRGGCTVTSYALTGNRFNNPYCDYRIRRERECLGKGEII
jgi:radical SAM protein with 4Fe4S-binding SPASM domain